MHQWRRVTPSGRRARRAAARGTLGASTVVLVGLFLVARVIVASMFLNATLHERRGAWFTRSG